MAHTGTKPYKSKTGKLILPEKGKKKASHKSKSAHRKR